MALTATLFKATLQIADMDRHYYADHVLSIARHPSETDERMMMRLLAFALNAHDALSFGRGLSTEDEPDLWRKDLTGNIEQWIEVGQPDERRLRKAGNRAQRVSVYSYGGRVADTWWEQQHDALQSIDNLEVVNIPYPASRELATLTQRSMQLQCTIQEGQVWMTDGTRSVSMELQVRKTANPA